MKCWRGFGLAFAGNFPLSNRLARQQPSRLPLPLPSGDTPKPNDTSIRLMDDRISTRFWFEHSPGVRLYPYKLRDNRTGHSAFRVAEPRAGANRAANQFLLDDVEDMCRHVMQMAGRCEFDQWIDVPRDCTTRTAIASPALPNMKKW